MFRLMCKSKIENATVTKKKLHYSGSLGIDKKILRACDLYLNEMIHVLNLSNGARFETYCIEEKEGSGTIALYGPAARQGEIGDKIIIISQIIVDTEEAPNIKMKIVKLGEGNIIKK